MWLAENLDATAVAYEFTRVCTRTAPGNHIHNHTYNPPIGSRRRRRVTNNRFGCTVIIFITFGVAILAAGYILGIPTLVTTGAILLILVLIVWILRQSQSVVLASLRMRDRPPLRASKRSPTVPINGAAPTSARRSPSRMDLN